MEKIIVKVSRYDPLEGTTRIIKYNIPFIKNGMSVIQILQYINKEYGLAFRSSCNIGFCGLCLVNVNGKPCKACRTLIKEPKELIIEPCSNLKPLLDLVYDQIVKKESDIKKNRSE